MPEKSKRRTPKRIAIWALVEPEILEQLEAIRGDLSRSVFLRGLIMDAIEEAGESPATPSRHAADRGESLRKMAPVHRLDT